MSSLAVIVPATNRPAVLDRCTAAIRAAADAPEELIVVDGPAGLGPAAARNLGAERAQSEILAFVDADVEVHPDAFTRIRAGFEDPSLAALFGSYDDAPAAGDVVSTFRNLLHHHVHQSSPGPASTFWAGLGAVRRSIFAAAGGFDEDRFSEPSVEDIELGMRLARSGAEIRLDPDLLGKHLKAWGFTDMVRTDFSRRGVPWVSLLLEERGAGSTGALNLGWRHRLSAAACVIGALALLRRRLWLAGAAALTLVSLNRSFYSMLARRDPRLGVLGIGLHAIHHLTSAAAVPAGIAVHLLDGRPGTARARRHG